MVEADRDRPGAFTVLLDGTPQSYIDTGDPTNLVFEYVRRIGHVIDLARPAGEPVTAVHLGGGGFTLPRYIAATRPGSRQQVLENDRGLIDAVRAAAPLPKREQIKIRCADATQAASVLPAGMHGTVDVLIVDVFAGARTPAALTTTEFFASLLPLLAAGAVVALNVADGAPLAFARSVTATVAGVFGDVAIAAEPAVLKGRRFGNLVLVAGAVPDRLARRLAGDPFPGTLLAGPDATRFVGGAKPFTSANTQDSPMPPRGVFG
ncbi:spermidine synthase [Tsukamurella paurometabola]|uniref:Spermidine synthase n=1 Tax=Tsukamurella paurometabola TaxID=2061 RepID=A0A3P8MCI0_TSUPA|nr:fused MFS/spermidine synthase [Tsukamurella paurometabola]UEA83461.1 fused MFS/spermidine synthase [Tsukamurella paurometabola]VDR40580.1 spermidine synthase [Tsukamurella paurometabola]